MDSSNLEENEFVCCEFEIAACKPSLQDLKKESHVHCGRIFVSEKETFIFICTFCEELFLNIEHFKSHMKHYHRSNMKLSFGVLNFDKNSMEHTETENDNNVIIHDNQDDYIYQENEISNMSYDNTCKINEQNVNEIPEISLDRTHGEKNKNIPEDDAVNSNQNNVKAIYDNEQTNKINTIEKKSRNLHGDWLDSNDEKLFQTMQSNGDRINENICESISDNSDQNNSSEEIYFNEQNTILNNNIEEISESIFKSINMDKFLSNEDDDGSLKIASKTSFLSENDDLKNECNVFCGKIFVSEKKNFVLICTFCEKLFSKIEEFMFHLKRNHRNNMKWSINKFDYDEDDQFQYAQANQESKIVNDVNQKNDTQYTTEISNYSYNETYKMNDKQNVDEIPEILVHDSENEENKNITEKVTKNIIWNRVNVRHDHGQDIKENTITIAEKLENVSNSKNINAFSLDADKDDEAILKTDPITLLSENDDRLKSQKKKKQMNKNFEKKFYCPICPRNFGSEKRFQTHNFMYHHHTDIVKSINTNITCGTCNKSFATQENFKTHLLVCCSKIGSKSVKVDQLTMESDFGKKNEINVNEVNTQNCEGTVFAESIGLNPCICKFCYKQLKTPLKRSIHELIHTGEKPFSCEFYLKKKSLTYCGKIFVSEEENFVYLCTFCEEVFTKLEEFKFHMKHHHWKNMKCNIENFDYDNDPFQNMETRKNNTIVNDCNKENDHDTHQINEKQYGNKIPEIRDHKTDDEKNKNLSEDFTDNTNLNKINAAYDTEQDIKKTNTNGENSKNILEFMLCTDTDDNGLTQTQSEISYLSEKNDRLKSQKKKKQMNKNFGKKFYCPICDRNLGSEAKLRIHNLVNHNKTDIVKSINMNITCRTCNKSFATEDNLKTHLSVCCTKIGSKTVKVELTMESDDGKNNEINVNEVNTQNCEGTVFAESIGLNPRICKFCYKQFKTTIDRARHELIHTGEKPFSCEYCKKTFRTKKQLDVHVMMHKGLKPYKCEVCGLLFTVNSNLIVHMRRHVGERKYKCEYCDKKFVTSSERKTHLRIHTGEKPYKCSLCDNRFSRTSFLTEHMQRVHSEETFKCEQCEKVFSTKKSLKVHTKTHSKERPFECNVCQKRFLVNKNLKIHLKLHSNATQYLCSICGKGFQQPSGLGIHMKTHKNVKNDK